MHFHASCAEVHDFRHIASWVSLFMSQSHGSADDVESVVMFTSEFKSSWLFDWQFDFHIDLVSP